MENVQLEYLLVGKGRSNGGNIRNQNQSIISLENAKTKRILGRTYPGWEMLKYSHHLFFAQQYLTEKKSPAIPFSIIRRQRPN